MCRSSVGSTDVAHGQGSMKMPASLQNLIVPPARIAEVSGFDGFLRTQRIEDEVRQVALHETGHAVAWALNGGTLVQTTMIPVGDEHCVQWGLTTYDVPDDPSMVERHRLAFSGMGASALCELAGDPDPSGTIDDFERSAEDLWSIYPDPDKLCCQLIQMWIQVLKFFGTPRVWRTADTFARRLIAEGTIKGFPDDCISDDNSPIPGLEEALATALGPPGSCDQFV